MVTSKDEYDYVERKPVYNFNDSSGQLSAGMKGIYDSIKQIAIDNLTEKTFREFYENDHFFMADFTDITVGHEAVGFLYATFYHYPASSPQYIAKAFHAVTKEKRQVGKPYDRSKLYKKFIDFYLKRIVLLELKKSGADIENSWVMKGGIPSLSDIKYLLNGSLASLKKKEILQVEIFAENPTTYYDIRNYELQHTSIKPKPGEEDWVNGLTTEQLLLESFRLSEKYENGLLPMPKYLEETFYTVNTSPQEWRKSFNTSKKEKKFYVWQNYRFPNYAFKIIIPVNPDNILNAVFRIVEIKGNKTIKIFLNKLSKEINKNTRKVKSVVVKKLINSLTNIINKFSARLDNSEKEIRIPKLIKKGIRKIWIG